MQLPSKQRQSQSSLNNKIANIDHYLQSVERDMTALSTEQDLWRQERGEWQEASLRHLTQAEGKLKTELADIEREIRGRDQRAREAVEKIHGRIKAIQDIQNRCAALVGQLHKRIAAVEQVLGGE